MKAVKYMVPPDPCFVPSPARLCDGEPRKNFPIPNHLNRNNHHPQGNLNRNRAKTMVTSHIIGSPALLPRLSLLPINPQDQTGRGPLSFSPFRSTNLTHNSRSLL